MGTVSKKHKQNMTENIQFDDIVKVQFDSYL